MSINAQNITDEENFDYEVSDNGNGFIELIVIHSGSGSAQGISIAKRDLREVIILLKPHLDKMPF